MFEGWDSYFLLVGGAAGALIGLLFVVASLPTGTERQARMRGASLYMSPVVFHFTVVMALSGTALAPRLHPLHLGMIVAAIALVGAIHLALVTAGIRSYRPAAATPHWSDLWCYGVGPLLLYVALGAVSVALDADLAWAPDALAAATLALLLIGIRNAWDLVTWLAPSAPSPDRQA